MYCVCQCATVKV